MQSSLEIYNQYDIISDPIASFLKCNLVGDYYHPPFNYTFLYEATKKNAHHESALDAKKNILMSCFEPTRYLSAIEATKFMVDYFMFGNAYLIPIRNKLGGVLKFDHRMANNIRKKVDGSYAFFHNSEKSLGSVERTEIKELIHFKEYDPTQNIYGTPKYLSALLDIVLNHSATMFRYRYYKNGSHAGFILNINGDISTDDLEGIKAQLKASKGENNFSNMLVHLPRGEKGAIQLIPISEISTKDEFVNIKSVTRDDILAAHRIPPELLSIIPSNIGAGGFGNVKDRAEVYYINEMMPLITRFMGINEQLGLEVFKFKEYALIKDNK